MQTFIFKYLMNAIFQLILFSLLPLVFYIITRRTIKGFLAYIGLKKVAYIKSFKKIILLFLAAYSFNLITITIIYLKGELAKINAIGSSFSDDDLGMIFLILSVLIYSFIQTGLSEEIFFRGFLAKRLISKTGYFYGNLIQAITFGSIHYFSLNGASTKVRILEMITATIMGYFYCYINERKTNGSIVIGWIFHAITNTATVIIFLVL
ncbi:CPBP family intramembrane glutamic endopeptidase [Halothermothrix orenii]|uniref:Abortive infection protein n=1 Tax=Halothermothrix orenii (strain H 168 / OCM 544 / DSM 9562) TaxID=373903 RepID=B8D038_HALOH|nr:type II CAAX endopeptidase family protein [Halothermothrix orenii]ACL68792.1 Abortive infection protein [Halothermothrix orenii H 168]